MRVLVVDDSMIMRRVVIDALRSFSDAEVVEAGTAEEGLDVMRDPGGPPVDLVLLDWYLPGMSGIEALQALGAAPGGARQGGSAASRPPVVMVTSEREKSNVIAALRAGAANYIVKPFTQQVFRKKVGPLLEDRPEAASPPAGTLTGNLAHTSPLEVVQLISITKKTGVLEFAAPGGRFELYFKSGQLDHAEGEGLTGEAAVAAATALSEGTFTFRTEAREHTATISRSTDMIMLDAFRGASEAT